MKVKCKIELKIKIKLATQPNAATSFFFGRKKIVRGRTLPHGRGLQNKPRMLCGIPFEIPIWRTPRGKIKLKDIKVTAKRGKKRDAGDTTHKLLKGKELTVQRLSSEVSGKTQKYARIGPREFVSLPKMN